MKITNRFVLRERTNEVHGRLEKAVGEFTDARTYIRYLEGMRIFRQVVERDLPFTGAVATADNWKPIAIAPLLRQDLEDLGRKTPCAAAMAFDLPSDREELLGVLYVLEGSGLGARVLMRRAALLGFSSNYGARHLAVQASRADSWNSLLKLLDEIASADIERTVRAARMTFEAALHAFNSKDAPQVHP